MAAFSGLSDRLNHIFSKIKNRGKLSELEIKQTMREIRIALLEADVNLAVVKDFIAKISTEAVGEKIMQSLTPGQQVVKIVNEQLTALMGTTNQKLNFSSNPPTIIMLCGLQGAGKTTACGKLALNLKKQGKRPLLVACDIYRPAAINQLKVVANGAGAAFFEKGTQSPIKTAKESLKEAQKLNCDVIILDTAGRLHINDELMEELKDIKKAVKPTEILLTVDAMTGQDAVTVAEAFNVRLDITGVILTKLDGDTRGGAALSIRAVTGKPIKFCGIGEKAGDLEPFHPDRMAGRILGMGDVLSFIEKASADVTEQQMKEMEKKLKDMSFTLEDFLTQLESLKKMGSLSDIMNMLPGANKMKLSQKELDEKQLARSKAIIQSMTKQERNNPHIIKASRRKRIAEGSGTSIQAVNQLLKQFEQSKEMMKKMKGNRGLFGKRSPFGGF